MNMKCHLRSSNSKGFTNLYHTSLQLPVKVLEVLDPLFFLSPVKQKYFENVFEELNMATRLQPYSWENTEQLRCDPA